MVELPAFRHPAVTSRCRCGCVVGLAVGRQIDDRSGVLEHGGVMVLREPCREHRAAGRFRAEDKAAEAEMPATMATVSWLVREINREVG